jgi:hypothetical protein
VFSQVESGGINNSVDYFNNRTEAVKLAKKMKWKELIPIAESLTQQYQKDGDIFYLLGLSYYETLQYQKAIGALRKTLDLGGTILVVPTGSCPSNDIMIKIAKAYAMDGEKDNAMIWLKKGFASRYDEKFYLKRDPAFSSFNKDEDFLQLFGVGNQTDMTREEAWAGDLNYLQKRIIEVHYALDDVITKDDFNRLFDKLKSSINTLSDEQIVVEIMKIMGSLGSGHNFVIPTTPKIGSLKKLPIQFYQFDDGMFIVDAEADFEEWIGLKVENIGETSIEEALEKTNLVNARDNEMQTLWLGPLFLVMPDVLYGLGIVENNDLVTITGTDSNGKSQKLTMKPISWNFTGFPKTPPLIKDPQPIYLSKIDNPYWYKSMLDDNLLYVQFNDVVDKEEQSLEDFSLELQNLTEQNKTQFLILDLRHNSGGNGAIRNHMLKLLVKFEARNLEGKVFVLMGRGTYSAAQNLLTEISVQTNAILVGERSSSKPSFIGESGWFQLPYSGLIGVAASQYHNSSEAEDFRKWIAPHIPVSLSSKDYFNGQDKALNIIMEVIKTSENKNKK